MAKKGKGKTPESREPVVRDANGRVAGGGSLNPGGLPKWRREFADAFGERCAPKAERVLNRILDRALNIDVLEAVLESDGSSEAKLAAEKRISDRMAQGGAAADTVLKYVLPKPTQQVEVSATPGTAAAFAGLSASQLLEIAKMKPPEGT